MQSHSLLTVITIQTAEKTSPPTLAQIPIKQESSAPFNFISTFPQPQCQSNSIEKVIPGYNFQSLFRKKSHIRMARKKNREEHHRKSTSIKMEHLQSETKTTLKGHWSAEQNKLYHWFLQIHSQHFIQKHLRRTDKIFKAMANFIKTREAEQCRSHHQKMEKKYHTFYQILLKLRIKFYQSPSEEFLRLELEQNNYKIPGFTLISEHQLNSGQTCKRQESVIDQDSQKSAQNSIQYQSQSNNNEHSLLGQNYERQLNFHFQSL